mgnify:CR=1 FL=1
MIEIESRPVILPNPRAKVRRRTAPQLSVVIPAFNEAARIGPYLNRIHEYLEAAYPGDSETLVVDDGSTDTTSELVSSLCAKRPSLRLIRMKSNCGKGAAVRAGVLAARGRRILFADADGATPIEEERRLSLAIAEGAIIACGSRRLEADGVARTRNLRRELASGIFRAVASCLVGVGVKDTQCGFKMLEANAAKRLFRHVRESGYLFDIEVLAFARRSGDAIAEVAVNWSEKDGSKVRLMRDSLRMFAGLWRLRRRMLRIPTIVSIPRAA